MPDDNGKRKAVNLFLTSSSLSLGLVPSIAQVGDLLLKTGNKVFQTVCNEIGAAFGLANL
jgi:hypothetical protein